MNLVTVTYDGLMEQARKAINLKALEELVGNIVGMLMEKNSKYRDAWQHFGIFTPLLRIREKLIRLETLQDGRTVLTYNSEILAELGDIVGYGLLAMLWMDENGQDLQQSANQLSLQFEHPLNYFPAVEGKGDYIDLVVRFTTKEHLPDVSRLVDQLQDIGQLEGYVEIAENGSRTIHVFKKK